MLSLRRLDTRERRLSSRRPGGRLKAQLPVASPTLVLPGTSQRLHVTLPKRKHFCPSLNKSSSSQKVCDYLHSIM